MRGVGCVASPLAFPPSTVEVPGEPGRPCSWVIVPATCQWKSARGVRDANRRTYGWVTGQGSIPLPQLETEGRWLSWEVHARGIPRRLGLWPIERKLEWLTDSWQTRVSRSMTR